MLPGTIAAIEECTAGSDAGRMSFPQVIAALTAAGIERYHADLTCAQKTYYVVGGEARTLGCVPLSAPPAIAFSAAGVERSVRVVQAGRLDYHGFCAAIAAAGCVGYHVSIPGARAVYYGRTSEFHVELFPDPR